MSDHLPPALRPDRRETAQERQDALYAEARRLAASVEYFGNWLGTIWDFDLDAVDDHDIWALREIGAWMETMPVTMRAAFMAYVKRERAEFRRDHPGRDQDAVTIMGTTLPGQKENT